MINKSFLIFFFSFLLFFLIASNTFANDNHIEIGISTGFFLDPFAFSELYNVAADEDVYAEFVPATIYLFYHIKFYFYTLSFENLLHYVLDGAAASYGIYFLKGGLGISFYFFDLFPGNKYVENTEGLLKILSFRLWSNIGLGYYFAKVLWPENEGNLSLKGKFFQDGLVFIEVNGAVGLKLSKKFQFYFGITTPKICYFFTTQIEEFSSVKYFIMFSYRL